MTQQATIEIPQVDATLCLGCGTVWFRRKSNEKDWVCDHCKGDKYQDTKIPLRFPGDTDNAPMADPDPKE